MNADVCGLCFISPCGFSIWQLFSAVLVVQVIRTIFFVIRTFLLFQFLYETFPMYHELELMVDFLFLIFEDWYRISKILIHRTLNVERPAIWNTLRYCCLFVCLCFMILRLTDRTWKTPFWDIAANWYVPSQVCKQIWIGRPVCYKQSLTSVGINAIFRHTGANVCSLFWKQKISDFIMFSSFCKHL